MANVFRKSALERLSSPDRLDSMLRLTSPMSWLGIGAAMILVIAVVVWAFIGQIPTTVDCLGFLTYHNNGGNTLYNTAAGRVQALLVQPGDRVEEGASVAEIAGIGGQSILVQADQPGVIGEQLVETGQEVVPNQGLFRLLPDDDSALTLVCYVSRATALQLESGMDVMVYLERAGADCGWMEGQVAGVDRVPSSTETMAAVVGDDAQMLTQLTEQEANVAVTCTLRQDAGTASGYYFSGPGGAEMQLYGGLAASVQITLAQDPPIAWVFPMLGGDAA